jgi:hypothetical protein
MVVLKKMDIHVLLSRNENSYLTLDAGNDLLDEQDRWNDCLFLKVNFGKKEFLQFHIFEKIGQQDNIIKRYTFEINYFFKERV